MPAHACDREPGSSLSEQLPASLFSHTKDKFPTCLTKGSKPRPSRWSSNSQTLLLLRGRLSFEASLVNGLAELLLAYLAIVVNHCGLSFFHADIGSLHSLGLLQASFHANGAGSAGHSRNLDLSSGVFRHRRSGVQQHNRKQP